MSDRVTTSDVMHEVHALRKDVKSQGEAIRKTAEDLHRLVEEHNEHEKRIAALEPIREGYRTVVACNDAIIRHLQTLEENQRVLIDEVRAGVEQSLRSDVLEMRRELRTEMSRLTTANDKMCKMLSERPCITTGECSQEG